MISFTLKESDFLKKETQELFDWFRESYADMNAFINGLTFFDWEIIPQAQAMKITRDDLP